MSTLKMSLWDYTEVNEFYIFVSKPVCLYIFNENVYIYIYIYQSLVKIKYSQ